MNIKANLKIIQAWKQCEAHYHFNLVRPMLIKLGLAPASVLEMIGVQNGDVKEWLNNNRDAIFQTWQVYAEGDLYCPVDASDLIAPIAIFAVNNIKNAIPIETAGAFPVLNYVRSQGNAYRQIVNSYQNLNSIIEETYAAIGEILLYTVLSLYEEEMEHLAEACSEWAERKMDEEDED